MTGDKERTRTKDKVFRCAKIMLEALLTGFNNLIQQRAIQNYFCKFAVELYTLKTAKTL